MSRAQCGYRPSKSHRSSEGKRISLHVQLQYAVQSPVAIPQSREISRVDEMPKDDKRSNAAAACVLPQSISCLPFNSIPPSASLASWSPFNSERENLSSGSRQPSHVLDLSVCRSVGLSAYTSQRENPVATLLRAAGPVSSTLHWGHTFKRAFKTVNIVTSSSLSPKFLQQFSHRNCSGQSRGLT